MATRESEIITGLVAYLNEKNLLTREELGLRIIKAFEEAGEAAAAWIGFTGQNPRKGITHSKEDVINELFDTAVTSLVAAESISGTPIWAKFYGHLHGLLRRTRETPEPGRGLLQAHYLRNGVTTVEHFYMPDGTSALGTTWGDVLSGDIVLGVDGVPYRVRRIGYEFYLSHPAGGAEIHGRPPLGARVVRLIPSSTTLAVNRIRVAFPEMEIVSERTSR